MTVTVDGPPDLCAAYAHKIKFDLPLGGASVGIAVDGVSEVLRVAKSSVDAMPATLTHFVELRRLATCSAKPDAICGPLRHG